MISVMNNDAEFDKRSDKIEEEARVSADDAIDSSNVENRLSFGVSNEEARVSSMEVDSTDVRVSEDERSEEVRESDVDGVDKGIGAESRVFDEKDQIDERNYRVNDDENGRVGNVKDSGSEYKSLLSEFDDYVANDRVGGGTSRALSYGFEVGDMVWGKVKSHPWWPGHIFNEAFASPSVRRTRREGHVLVAFFGDSSYGWFDPAELVPFDSHFMEKSQQTNSRTFVKAVEEAMDEASRRRGLGLVCKCRNPYNFRPTNVQGYFAVDVPDYEPNAVYSVNQIRTARNNFKPSEILAFVKKMASAPGDCDQKTIEFFKNKATVSSLRKAVFEEFDETYAQAFGVQPSRRSDAPVDKSNHPVKQPPRAPLSGPLVIAEALGGGKSSKKNTKVKDNLKKDRYLFKRRDEASDLQTPEISQGQSSSLTQLAYREGSPTFLAGDYVLQKRSPMSQIPLKQEQTVFMSRDSPNSIGDLSGNEVPTVNQTSAHIAAVEGKPSLDKNDGASASSMQEGSAILDVKPEEGGKLSQLYEGVLKSDADFTAKLEGGQGSDQVRDGGSGGHPAVMDVKRSGMSTEGGVKKAKKRPSADIGAENSALGEKKKKKKKKEAGPEAYSDQPQKPLVLGKGGAKSAQIGLGPREESQVNFQKKDVGLANSSSNTGNSGLDLKHLLSDLHALALDPFHGVERNSPTIIRQFFLRFRSLVYQKSLPSEMEPVEVRASKPLPDNLPNENVRDSTASKAMRPLVRPDDPTKSGRKRLPSDRQEEIAAKRLKKISQLKSLAAEKKATLRTMEAPKIEGKEQPNAGPPARPVRKPDSARKMEPLQRAIEPTMLVMKFPPQVSLPSVPELKARFGRFGSLDQSAIRVFWKSSTCRVVFRYKTDAQAAYRYANGNNSLFGNVNVRYHLRSVEAPTAEALDFDKARGDDTGSEITRVKEPLAERSAPVLAHQPLPQPAVQLKSCLKKPTSDEAGQASSGNGGRGTARVKFVLGGEETSRGEQLMVGNRNNFNNNASFADGIGGAAPSSVAMEFNSKNFQKVIPPSSSPSTIHPLPPQFGKTPTNNLHHTEVGPRNSHNLNTQTIPPLPQPQPQPPSTTSSIDISQQMLSLLTRCNDVVTNVTGLLGYVPYHPL
ncbi:Tudor/PWWP/MBT superfamily protein [Corchorus olitorius]|uniref:Tudor/PWWP/MBT superfamily protein n=1 Tax=Corchorus olitorius TaxID=93759 RepID=A0A1R3KQK2_9ROSI|nr:Tudor/PWWP/MBT superfamily protein [Corchorus olitorius]